MAGSAYLTVDEAAGYDCPKATNASIRAASSLIDAYIGRPEGLVYVPDAKGNPCYMYALDPKVTLVAQGAILPGQTVQISVTGATLDNNWCGETIILDRANPQLVECCVIQAVGPDFVTLTSVRNNHADQTKMDIGLTIMEEFELPDDRSIARLKRPNPLKLLSGAGRYGYGRRSQQVTGDYQEFNLLAAVSSFGGPPLWIPWDPMNASMSMRTGEAWVPAGILLAYFTDVRTWYIAGYTDDNIPSRVKQACANIINLGKESGLGANIRSRTMQNATTVSKWENNMIDQNTRQLLNPEKIRAFL